MIVHNITTMINFSFALLLFLSILFKQFDVKITKHFVKRYAIYASAFLPLLFVPLSVRLPVVFIVSLLLVMMTYRFNLYQSFWITVLFLLVSMLNEMFLIVTIGEILVLFSFGFSVYVIQFLLPFTIALCTQLLKKHFVRFIEKSHIVKNFQITYPLVIVSFIFFYSIYASLIFYNVIEFRVKMYTSMLFILLFISIAIAIIIFADRSLKNKNELAKISKRILGFNTQNSNDLKNDPFTLSVEYDLFNSTSGEVIASNFTLDALLYKNTNSTIYLLKDRVDLQVYTMKVIEKRVGIDYDFERIKQIRCPAIVPIHLTAEGEKYHYIVKPYINGIDLDRYVEDHGPIEQTLINKILIQLANALDVLHTHHEPIVYRDLKPSNIIFNPETECIHLIDIESIRKFNASKSSDTFIIGSRGYTPPEQYGFSQTRPQSDIYAFGATLYYLITGKEPDYYAISKTEHNLEVPPFYLDIIRKCMAFNPEDRYSNIKEILQII